MDWALIETWKEMDIPLHVALRGIEKAFDSWESKPRKRSVKSLLYCQEEVEAQFAEWREARVGAGESEEQEQNGAVARPRGPQPGSPVGAGRSGRASSDAPFTRAAILEHLKQGCISLAAARKRRMKTGEDDFSDALERAAALLAELEQDLAPATLLDAQKLETSLTGVERMLSDSVRSVAGADELATLEKEVKEQLKPYRKQMESAAYQQTFDNLLLKRLREQFGVPRLSLFYL